VYIRGRKKEMIVTPEGLNVFPEDVERVLVRLPGVADAAVVGRTRNGEERVHAVLVLSPGADADALVRTANATLPEHQRIRGVSVWPGHELPRTEGTGKLKRRDVKAWVESDGAVRPAPRGSQETSLEAVISRFAHGAGDVTDDMSLEALGLTSLERVELLMALEERFNRTLDESRFAAARTVDDLRQLLEDADAGNVPSADRASVGMDGGAGHPTSPEATADHRRLGGGGQPRPDRTQTEVVDFPRWNRHALARVIRRVSYPTWLLPLLRVFVRLRVEGREHLDAIHGPVVFAANHQSHLDAPAILAALPPARRYRVAIAMAKEFFKAHFFPEQYGRGAWFTNSLNYYLATLFFNAFPLPQREAGTRDTLRYAGELISDGYSILIFPEGRRTDQGEIRPFRAGIGMIAARLALPVVPVRLEGLDRVLHHSWRMARPGAARVTFGKPLRLEGDAYAALAKQVEDAVKNL
jgi:long-chain acyl-CoA synthetase